MSSPSSIKTTPISQPQLVELPPLPAQASVGAALLGAHSGVLDSVKVALSVVVGQAHTTLGELMNLKELSVLAIDRLVDTPVDLVINGSVVARGQLVVVDDNFGVRITEVAMQGKA